MSIAEIAEKPAKETDVAGTMAEIGRRARAAARTLALASTETKNRALTAGAASLRKNSAAILAENAKDVADMKKAGGTAAFIDRLTLTEARIEAMAAGLEAIAALPDPVGSLMAEWDRPNGLHIARVRTPLGVIGVIFESRPNVTADAGALCLKAGNAAILRGGSDSFRSSTAIHGCLVEGLSTAGLPAEAIQIVPTRDRAAVGQMLAGLDGNLDVIVPRGGKSLVARVQKEARVPVFAHLEGIVHVYVHAAADLAMAEKLLVNAKMRRVSICGAAETLLVDKAVAATHLKPLVEALQKAGCAIRGDKATRSRRRRCDARQRRRLDDRISRRGDRGEGGRRPRCSHRPYRALRLAPHRHDRHRRPGRRRPLHGRGRFGDRAAQCFDPVRRWRRVRHGRRDRHRHRAHACPRAGRRRAAHQLQVSGAGLRPGTALSVRTAAAPSPASLVSLPPFWPGMRIGLFGGSFDPAHDGHRRVSLEALKRLHLDQVWWLVSPQNPLKPNAPSSDLARRIAAAEKVAGHPRIRVTGVEAAFGTTYSAETLARLLPRLCGVRPVWMMGADNLASFHHWRDWQRIAATLPIAVFNRPGDTLRALASPAAKTFARFRLGAAEAPLLAVTPAPAWLFLPSPHIDISSTALRRLATGPVLAS